VYASVPGGSWFMRTGRSWQLAVAAILLAALPARSQDTPATGNEADYFMQLDTELYKLGSSLTDSVVSSTKTAQRGAETPAVITIVTAEEIRWRGYGSLAEILRSVPGFYDVYDLVTHNVGVRGINGGARASGGIIKVMIDGHPVDFRPSTGNFYGEELVPLAVVERIEIIRGPASALYGANAFLGVVNVITQTGKNLSGTRARVRGATVRNHPGGGVGLVQGVSNDTFDALMAFDWSYFDRSGLKLPPSSPDLKDVANAGLASEVSRGDISRPMTFFGKTSAQLAAGKLTLLASIQSLDSKGEFLDTGTLTHGTRVSLLNQNYRLTYEAAPSEKVNFKLSASYLRARPGEGERFDLGRGDTVLLRRAGADGIAFNAETQAAPITWLNLVAGADLAFEDHQLQTFDRLQTVDLLAADGTTVSRSAGTVLPGDGYGKHSTFKNYGLFGQGIVKMGENWNATAGARLDWHNIYGINPSYRGGLVYAPKAQSLTAKLLYGSSFKAPSAEQLYTYPMDFYDIRGNPTLKAQTAHTFELVGGYGFDHDRGEVVLNLFASNVIGRVEFLQRALFLEAQNIANEWVAGAELDARYRIIKPLQLRLSGGFAKTLAKDSKSAISEQTRVTNSLFPPFQIHLLADYLLPLASLRLSAEVSYISPRAASQSNAVLNQTAYNSPGYVFTALALASPSFKLLGERETSAVLRVSNVINSNWRDSGFGGIDVPAQGLTALLTLSQTL
jgi:outer membrane receptor for ferrienterochelin and colicins